MRKASWLVPAIVLLVVVSSAFAQNVKRLRADLVGFEEAPAISTVGEGEFRAQIDDNHISDELNYADLEGNVTQAHIHFGQRVGNGGISAFLCANPGGVGVGIVPAGTQACPPSSDN